MLVFFVFGCFDIQYFDFNKHQNITLLLTLQNFD
nr:MAG TPA: hypothetical protein [Caudoviricetes sp.]